ncbi:MAG: CDP-alcohol phosphatidyltransferase family protein [Chitinophagales bacterium]
MTLATWFTLLRLALVPVFAAAYFHTGAAGRWWAAGALALAGLTDILDGRLARLRREESLAGRLLDPLADKLVTLTGIGLLVLAGNLKPWIAWVLVLKETLLMAGGALFYALRREMLPSNWVGKTASVLLYAGIFSGLLLPGYPRLSEAVILLGLGFSVAAGLNYTRRAVYTAKGE